MTLGVVDTLLVTDVVVVEEGQAETVALLCTEREVRGEGVGEVVGPFGQEG